MSYLQFPQANLLKVVAASGENLGSFQLGEPTELKYILLNTYIKGTITGSEKMRLKLYASSLKNTAVTTSDWVYWSTIDGIGTGNWLGWIRFDFDLQPLNDDYYYYMDIETSGYTRNGNTHYLAAVCEYCVTLNTLASDIGVHMAIIGER
jgi:hypothetical protein